MARPAAFESVASTSVKWILSGQTIVSRKGKDLFVAAFTENVADPKWSSFVIHHIFSIGMAIRWRNASKQGGSPEKLQAVMRMIRDNLLA